MSDRVRSIRAALMAARPKGYDIGGGVSSLGSYGGGINDVLQTLGIAPTASSASGGPTIQPGAINPVTQGIRSPILPAPVPPPTVAPVVAPVLATPDGGLNALSPGSGVGLGNADDAPDGGFAPNNDALGQAIGRGMSDVGFGLNSSPTGPDQSSANANAAAEAGSASSADSGGYGQGLGGDGEGPGGDAAGGEGMGGGEGAGGEGGQGEKRGGYIPVHHTEAVGHALRILAAHANQHGIPATINSIHRLIGRS